MVAEAALAAAAVVVMVESGGNSKEEEEDNKYKTIWWFPKIGGPQCRPQYTIILIMGTPEEVPVILGNYHIATL